jgi:hypothetical protein
MDEQVTHDGEASEPSPDDLLSIPQIARMYGINPASVRAWRLTPAKVIPFGSNGKFKLFRRADVEAYANSERRKNRVKAQKVRRA